MSENRSSNKRAVERAVLGVFSLLAIFLFISGVYFGLGHGGMEKMIVYSVLLRYVGFGGHLMASKEVASAK